MVPICLTPSFDLPSLFATFALPPVLVCLGRAAHGPLSSWYSAMQTESAAEEAKKKVAEAFSVAASDTVLMVGPALRKRKASHASGGLVVAQAIYGDVEAFKEGAPRSERRWLDVTVPVQFMCKSDKLTIHGGIQKHQLMGFCEPAPMEGGGHKLLVRYLFKNKPHECTVSDGGELSAPCEAHLISDRDLAASVRDLAENLVETEVAEDLIKRLIRT